MKKIFAGWKVSELAGLTACVVLIAITMMIIFRYNIVDAEVEIMSDSGIYSNFIQARVKVSRDTCSEDVQCHAKWANQDLPIFLTEVKRFPLPLVSRIQKDVWYITSGEAHADRLEQERVQPPDALVRALMK